MGKDNEALAQDRTDLAEDRTVLAHERSFAGWVRTGMASVGIGLGLNALFRALEPGWVAKAIATGFFLIAILIFYSAERRACRIISRLEAHTVSELGSIRIRFMSWSLVTVTVVLTGAIWLLVPV
ncbi:YidH family protein [Novosphingobium sp. M1R2S20]|uniref:YidH family protein n=1 Tax=Novosphingobium rhizovicinum TaxID=3228928 RepID=A0ABV3R709_9SPHN